MSHPLSGVEVFARAGDMREPLSQVDPNGYLFWRQGEPFRFIYPDAEAWMRAVLTAPSVRNLVAEGRLVDARPLDEAAPQLVLAHPRVRWRSYPHEWAAVMLKDAAGLIVRVAQELSSDGMALLDAHPWNVLFEKGRPIFVDWGSIGHAPVALAWTPLQQFQAFCLNPLHLYAAGQNELAAARLRDLAFGVSTDLMLRALPAAYQLRHPLLSAQLRFRRVLERQAGKGVSTTPALREAANPHLPRVRQVFFGSLQRAVERINVSPQPSDWGDYYAACPSLTSDEQALKDAQVETWLAQQRPDTLVDIGANAGRYSVMAARAGASVVALEQDEAALTHLYRIARGENLDILPLRVDVCDPGGGSGWCGSQRAGLFERVAADSALCLALVHHLVISRQVTFAQIAQMLSMVARRTALVEWVGPDDPMSVRLRATNPRDFSFFTLENFLNAFTGVGFHAQALDDLGPTRKLIQLVRG